MIEILYTVVKIFIIVVLLAKIVFLWFLIFKAKSIKKSLQECEKLIKALRTSVLTLGTLNMLKGFISKK